jgi:TonB family protein
LKITGVVRIEATVEPDGKVSEVKSISGNHMLSPAAEEAVRRWRFAPGTGVSTVVVDVSFAAAN